MSDFLKGYTEAVLNEVEYGLLSPEALKFIMDDCLKFSTGNKQFLLENYSCKFYRAGRDFWFARNDNEKNLLTQFCNNYPPLKVFRSINGKIYL